MMPTLHASGLSAVRPSLPPSGAATFRSKFLGLDENVNRLILTPLGSVLSALSGPDRGSGLWPSGLVRDVPIVQGPQGRAITDAIFNLPTGSQVIFLGLAGGLRPPAAVGKWISVGRVWSDGQAYDCSLESPPSLDIVTGATIGSLTESWASTASLAEQADVVDMETSHVYETANICGIRVLSLLLVSDEPPHRPFWETDLQSLNARVASLIDVIDPWLAGSSLNASTNRARLADGGNG
ncbi:hypothetical protein EDC02_7620 [Micromonospora sp. Llam0]|uniref:phosphorylase family protein n=1 Tax=Micromonospora sp. Llam0 TaxID=2485143 RepID=UPI000F9644B6|nr:hypothetical protein [Micromonospora sp. Llam0]ROO52680.1 hypothetical protein EDC02_7620 [Micromonospora sp. Llam0]